MPKRKKPAEAPLDPSLRRTVNISDMARMLGIGRTTAWSLLKSGQIEFISIGARRLPLIASIDRFIERRRLASNDPLPPTKPGKRKRGRPRKHPLPEATP